MKAPRWSAEEIAYFTEMAGDIPWPRVVARMRRKAKASGWPPRSEKALLIWARKNGIGCRARQASWTTAHGAGELLGCPPKRVEAWLRVPETRVILTPERIGGVQYIERSAWRRLARERPQVLGGFSAAALFLLLEDRELAEQVAKAHPIAQGDWRVRCVETGRIWSSCCAVARHYHVTPGAVSLAIRRGRPLAAAGLTFVALRKE